MARYLETARKLHDAIEKLATRLNLTNEDVAEIGLIANLAVRCCPRACQDWQCRWYGRGYRSR